MHSIFELDCLSSTIRRLLLIREKSKTTLLQAGTRQEKVNTIRLRISRFRDTQVIYMPGVPELRDEGVTPITASANDIVNHPAGRDTAAKEPSPASPTDDQPEHECMWLPSAIPRNMREKACVAGVIATETRMQLALMDDSLDNLRRLLRISSTIRADKRTNGGGTSQRVGTRTQTVLERFAEKIDRAAARYRAAYSAMTSLDPTGDWTNRLEELKPDDIRSPHRDRDEDKKKKKKKRKANDAPEERRDRPSEGRRELSWIWLRNGPSGRPTLENLTPEQISPGKHNLVNISLYNSS